MRYRISLLICVLACQVHPTVPLSDWTDWTDTDMEPTMPMMDDWWHEDDEGIAHKYLSDEEPDLVIIQLSCLASLLIAFCIPFAKDKKETQSVLVEKPVDEDSSPEIKEETPPFPLFSPISASSSSSFKNRKRFGPRARTTPTAAPMDMSFFIPEPLTPAPTFFIPEPVQLQEENCNPEQVVEEQDLCTPADLTHEQAPEEEITSSYLPGHVSNLSYFIPEQPPQTIPTFFIPEPVQLQEDNCNPAPVVEEHDLCTPAIAELALDQALGTESPSSHPTGLVTSPSYYIPEQPTTNQSYYIPEQPTPNQSYYIPEQPKPTATTYFVPQPVLSEGVPVFPVAEPVPEKGPEYVYERSEEEIPSMSSFRFPSNLNNPGPVSNQPIPGPAACPDPIRSSGPEITPVGQDLSDLIPTSNPIPETDLSRPATDPTVEVSEDSNEPVKHCENCEDRWSASEGMSGYLIPPEYKNAPYDPSRKAAISFNNSTYYMNPWILEDFLNFVEYHGYYVDRQVDVILGKLKRSGRATPREALLLLLTLRETSRIRTDSIVFMIEDFLYHNDLISHWTLMFFAEGLGAGWYIAP